MLVPVTDSWAHAEPVFIKPVKRQTLLNFPERVKIYYDEAIKGEFLEVYNDRGERVDEDDAKVEPPEPPTPTMTIEHKALYTVSLRQEDMPKGVYTVNYGVTSEDGHSVGETYEFRVGDAAEPRDSQPKDSQLKPSDSQPKDATQQVTLATLMPFLVFFGGMVLIVTLLIGVVSVLRRRT